MKEKLSALMDGELDRKATGDVLQTLASDSRLRCSWERWHLIRAALHQDLAETPVSGVASATADGLREEPTVLAPRGRLLPDRRDIGRWIGGAAIAASVAAVSVVGIRMVNPVPGTQPTQLATTQPVPNGNFVRTSDTRWNTISPDVENDLNLYMVEHSEFTPTSRMNGMMSYVRIVGYDSEQ
jgi:sigma-E factor negative regulatory protein RseA